MIDLNQKAKEIHEHNVTVGWWSGDNADIYTKLQLVSTEIAEATEGERKDLMDDKLPHRKMGEVELADALVRVLDLGEYLGLTTHMAYRMMDTNFLYGTTPAQIHLMLNRNLIVFADAVRLESKEVKDKYYTKLASAIIDSAELLGYNIIGAMVEKIAFNKTRPDHKVENRQAEGGKKF